MVLFRGSLRHPRVPWTEGMTLTRALAAAEYTGTLLREIALAADAIGRRARVAHIHAGTHEVALATHGGDKAKARDEADRAASRERAAIANEHEARASGLLQAIPHAASADLS